MQPHQTRDQKFVAEFVFGVAMVSATVASISYVHDCVVEEQGVAGGFVDDAVEDVSYYFALCLDEVSSWFTSDRTGQKLTTKLPDFCNAALAKFSPYRS